MGERCSGRVSGRESESGREREGEWARESESGRERVRVGE